MAISTTGRSGHKALTGKPLYSTDFDLVWYAYDGDGRQHTCAFIEGKDVRTDRVRRLHSEAMLVAVADLRCAPALLLASRDWQGPYAGLALNGYATRLLEAALGAPNIAEATGWYHLTGADLYRLYECAAERALGKNWHSRPPVGAPDPVPLPDAVLRRLRNGTASLFEVS